MIRHFALPSFFRKIEVFLSLLFIFPAPLFSQILISKSEVNTSETILQKKITEKNSLMNWFACFGQPGPTSFYAITLCADLPDNNNPRRVHVRDETGHVFIILSKTDSSFVKPPVNIVFGFYPRRPVSSIMFKNVRCEILDNGKREYNGSVQKQLNPEEFEAVLKEAVTLSKKKYNINKYNCYDFALGLFNSLQNIEKLPVSHIKFPFIFGKGGSPCVLYRDLKKLKEENSSWAPFIKLGLFEAPTSCD